MKLAHVWLLVILSLALGCGPDLNKSKNEGSPDAGDASTAHEDAAPTGPDAGPGMQDSGPETPDMAQDRDGGDDPDATPVGDGCILVEPADVVFPDTQVNSSTSEVITITNCSDDTDLVLGAVTRDGSAAFSFTEPLSATVPPRLVTSMAVEFAPQAVGEASAELRIESNADPVSVPLSGRATEPADCPTAVARAREAGTASWSQNVSTMPLRTIELSASDSTASSGTLDRYEWQILQRPQNSTSRLLPDAQAESPSLFLDLAGTYEIELRVWDSQDRESCNPSRVLIHAVPDEDIHVQLVWQTPSDVEQTDEFGADLDLHYLHPSGQWNNAPYDIYWMNPTSDWGAPGSDDDPSLDIDDTDGAGPENVNHNSPESESYGIGVYYYADNGYGPSYATVRVYLNGVLEYEAKDKFIQGFGDFWYVGEVDWAQQSVLVVDSEHEGFPNTP